MTLNDKPEEESAKAVIEDVLKKDLENIVTFLKPDGNARGALYEDVMEMVERCLFNIALERSGRVKTAAANYLGMNRNTFQKKLMRLGISNKRDV